VVFGGYGTFGAQVARELARMGVPLTIAGRDAGRAEAFARELGPAHRGLAADVTHRDSCRAALHQQTVAVNCAGPFSDFGSALLDACLDAGCHYADIADDRAYAALVRGYDARFRQRNLAAVYGCSSLPGISGALALTARDGGPRMAPKHARATLFIGNDNPKGRAAIASAVRILGKPIRAPQGILTGFGDRVMVPLPPPFGRREVFNFDSPEYDLFSELLGVRSVAVKFGFELRSANGTFALLAMLSSNYGDRTVALLERVGRLTRGRGCSGGAVMTELFYEDGLVRRASLSGGRDGQRMAALPCALVGRVLCAGVPSRYGVATAYELLGAGPLLEGIGVEGFTLRRSEGQRFRAAR
jgi:hypothetical protein